MVSRIVFNTHTYDIELKLQRKKRFKLVDTTTGLLYCVSYKITDVWFKEYKPKSITLVYYCIVRANFVHLRLRSKLRISH